MITSARTLQWLKNPIFLKWRKDAGMNNDIADDLPDLMKEIGMVEVEKMNSDEHYEKGRSDFKAKVGIWAKVADLTQMVEEGYLDNNLRLKAIEEYNEWIENQAVSMTMKLNEVRGKLSTKLDARSKNKRSDK